MYRDPVKLHGSLLSTSHPLGRFKARFFAARGDLCTVVELCGPDAIAVEFVAASGRTQALVTLIPADIRAVNDIDVVSVRPSRATAR